MNPHTLGLIIGGLCPTIFYGMSGVLARMSGQAPISAAGYVFAAGLGVTAVGAAAFVLEPRLLGSSESSAAVSLVYAALGGALWGLGSCLLIFAIARYGVPISQLAPLYNSNTLITVLFGLVVFSEWQSVSTPKILLGSALIILGSYIVLFAKR